MWWRRFIPERWRRKRTWGEILGRDTQPFYLLIRIYQAPRFRLTVRQLRPHYRERERTLLDVLRGLERFGFLTLATDYPNEDDFLAILTPDGREVGENLAYIVAEERRARDAGPEAHQEFLRVAKEGLKGDPRKSEE